MRDRVLAILVLMLIGGACPRASAQPPGIPQPSDGPPPIEPSVASRLGRVVLEAMGDKTHPGWDRDRNGALSGREIAMAVLDAANTGERAAAAAALHDWLINIGSSDAPKLDRAFFEKIRPFGAPEPERRSAPEQSGAANRWHMTAQQRRENISRGDDLDASFHAAKGRLRAASGTTDLFPKDGPAFGQIRQGSLGDCFLLAPLAALAHREPEAVRRMITLVPPKSATDGGPSRYRVTFPGARAVEIAAPTDGELALPGASARAANGLWVRIIEKAYGSLGMSVEARTGRCPTDWIQFGEAAIAGAALTGHTFETIRLIGNYKKPIAEADLASGTAVVRAKLLAAIGAQRLVVASNDAGIATPPGVVEGHSYAVIGFDAATDRVELYNTWAERFTPKGAEGLENGYAHERGIARIPLGEFSRAFTSILVETDRPSRK